MIAVATFCYGLLASFVVSSIGHNRRVRRDHPPILALFGWGMLAFSATAAAILFGFAGLTTSGVLTA